MLTGARKLCRVQAGSMRAPKLRQPVDMQSQSKPRDESPHQPTIGRNRDFVNSALRRQQPATCRKSRSEQTWSTIEQRPTQVISLDIVPPVALATTFKTQEPVSSWRDRENSSVSLARSRQSTEETELFTADQFAWRRKNAGISFCSISETDSLPASSQ